MSSASFKDYLAKSKQRGENLLAEAAISSGLHSFPCDFHKRPLTKRGFKDASNDPVNLREMFSRPDAVMIGVPTGEITGFIVIDVDIKENRQGDQWLNANSHRLPQTRTVRTGSGGLHLLYLWPGKPIKNSASKIAPGIDVRGDGGYVIVPPSPGYAIADDAPIAPVPGWLLPVLCPPEPVVAPVAPRPAPASYQSGGSPYGLAALANECDAIRCAPDGAKHDTINRAGYAIGGLVSAGELEHGPALADLLDALGSIRGRCKDFPAADKTLRRAFDEGRGAPRGVPERVIQPEEIHPAAALLEKLNTRFSQKVSKPLSVTPDLMDVGGVLQQFIDYCEATAFSSQPFLALGAGICALGALAGRRYSTQTDLRTNFYAIGIADSGGGKDHARGCIKRVIFSAGLGDYLGGSKIASGSGLLSALARHPSMLFQIDEIGLWLQNVLGKNAASHQREIWANLTELFTSANLPFGGTEYANQKDNARVVLYAPNACLYGTSVPNEFWAAIKSGALQNGSMARFLVFLSPENYPDTPLPKAAEPPQALVEAFHEIAAGVTGHDYGGNLAATMQAGVPMVPYRVPEHPDAYRALMALKADELAWKRQAEGTYATAMIARLFENSYKLALIRAISRNPQAPVIEASDVTWGKLLARHCIDTLLREAGRFVADNDYEGKVNKALDIIRRHGPISGRDMFRNGFKYPERERAEILKTLVDVGMVQATQHTHDGPGRPTIKYTVTPAGQGGGISAQ